MPGHVRNMTELLLSLLFKPPLQGFLSWVFYQDLLKNPPPYPPQWVKNTPYTEWVKVHHVRHCRKGLNEVELNETGDIYTIFL